LEKFFFFFSKTENNYYLYSAYFNHSTQHLNNPKCSNTYIIPTTIPINPLSDLPKYSLQITILFNILSENILNYPTILIIKKNLSKNICLQTSTTGEDYLIIVKDDLNFSYFLKLPS
jgi:hypothetical protein